MQRQTCSEEPFWLFVNRAVKSRVGGRLLLLWMNADKGGRSLSHSLLCSALIGCSPSPLSSDWLSAPLDDTEEQCTSRGGTTEAAPDTTGPGRRPGWDHNETRTEPGLHLDQGPRSAAFYLTRIEWIWKDLNRDWTIWSSWSDADDVTVTRDDTAVFSV